MEEARRNTLLPSLDAETFAALEQDFLPQLIAQARQDHHALRLWVAECDTGASAALLALRTADLLGRNLSDIRLKIFATNRQDTDLINARRGIFKREELAPLLNNEQIVRFCEPVGENYRLRPMLRKLIIFGKHDLWHDQLFAHLDLIVCGFSLQAYPREHQQRFLSRASVSLTRQGYLVCSQQDRAVLAHFPYTPVKKDLPIYRPIYINRPPEEYSPTEGEPARQEASVVQTMRHLLHTASIPERELSRQKLASPPVPSTNEMLLQFAPIGIVVLDQHYQIRSMNRTAQKLLTPLFYQERTPDFFHSIAGLPYQEVRMAIDSAIREGTSQTLEEVELSVATGGNGRVLSFEICSLPTDVGAPPCVALYVQDITMQTAQKKNQIQQVQVFQSLQNRHNDLEHRYEQLYEISHQLLNEYQSLALQLEEAQEARHQLEEQVEQLLEEITVLTEQEEL